MRSLIDTAILPVAGLGTRLLPATKSVPKELMPVYDRPLIQLAVDEARKAGIRRLIFVSHPSKSMIEDYFRPDHPISIDLAKRKPALAAKLEAMASVDGIEVIFVMQDKPLGLGHAILCAREKAGPNPVAVILPDDLMLSDRPTIGDMAHLYDPGFAEHMVGAMTVPHEDVSKYGIVDAEQPAPGRQVLIGGLCEKPDPDDAPSDLAVVGRYILGPSIFEALANTGPGSGGEIQLTDAIAQAIGTGGVSAYHISGERFDCGHHDGLLQASVAVRNRQTRPGCAA